MRALWLVLAMLWSGAASAGQIVWQMDFETMSPGDVVGQNNATSGMEVFAFEFGGPTAGRLTIKPGAPLPNAGTLSGYFDGVGGNYAMLTQGEVPVAQIPFDPDRQYLVKYDASPGVRVALAYDDVGGFRDGFLPRDAWYFGAALVMPRVSSEAMSLHLAEISRAVCPDAHAVLVCDGAGWHQAGGRLSVPANISLLHLPPYAPELNPMENVWEYLRANKLSMLVWHRYEAIVDACCSAWNWLLDDADRITSITTRAWAQVKS